MNLEEKYKEFTNKRLIEIIIKAEDYQPQAVEVARKILSEREVSDSEKNEVKKAIEIEKQTKKLQEEKEFETKLKTVNFLKI